MIEDHSLTCLDYLASDLSTKECRRSFNDSYSAILLICKQLVEEKEAHKFEVVSSSELLYKGLTLHLTKIEDLEEVKKYTALAFKLACSSSEENEQDRLILKATASIRDYIGSTYQYLEEKINIVKNSEITRLSEEIFAYTIRNGNLIVGFFKVGEGKRNPVLRKITFDSPEFKVESKVLERCKKFLYGKNCCKAEVVQEPLRQMLIYQHKFSILLENQYSSSNFQIIDREIIIIDGVRYSLSEGHLSEALSRYYSSIEALVLIYETFSISMKENAIWLDTIDREFIKINRKAIRKSVHELMINKGFKLKKIKQIILSPDRTASVMSHRGRISKLSLTDQELDLLALNQVYRRILKLKWEQEKETSVHRRTILHPRR